MAGYDGLPPEERLPEEDPSPAPEAFPPPEEGSSGDTSGEQRERGGFPGLRRGKSALLLALAGAALCAVIAASPVRPAPVSPGPAATIAPTPEPASAPTSAPAPSAAPTAAPTAPQTSPEPTAPPPEETEPPALTDAGRLTATGTWKNTAADEWAHFNADGSGWWYDGTWFGLMAWREDESGGVTYTAAMAYLDPERKSSYDWAPEKEGDTLHSVSAGGAIALEAEEDRFACPGLRFGEGEFIPDDTPIDASFIERVCGKTAGELISGTVWRMAETSDLGIPVAPSGEEKPELYTDLVYVESLDFSAGVYRLTARDGGLLQREHWGEDGSADREEPVEVLEVPFTLLDGEETAFAFLKLGTDVQYCYYSEYRAGDPEFSNLHLLWGHNTSASYAKAYLLITCSGLRLGMNSVDWYPHNYTLLAP